MSKRETALILLMAVPVWIMAAPFIALRKFSDLCFDVALESQERF